MQGFLLLIGWLGVHYATSSIIPAPHSVSVPARCDPCERDGIITVAITLHCYLGLVGSFLFPEDVDGWSGQHGEDD